MPFDKPAGYSLQIEGIRKQAIRKGQCERGVVRPCSRRLVVRAVALHAGDEERSSALELHGHAQGVTHGHAQNQRKRLVVRLFVILTWRTVEINVIGLVVWGFKNLAVARICPVKRAAILGNRCPEQAGFTGYRIRPLRIPYLAFPSWTLAAHVCSPPHICSTTSSSNVSAPSAVFSTFVTLNFVPRWMMVSSS